MFKWSLVPITGLAVEHLILATPTVSTMVINVLAFLSFIIAFQAFSDYRRRRGIPYPPGPRPLPIIGNIFDIPKENSWLAYTKFSKEYGNILSFHIFGRVIVVLNTVKATKDLLEKHGDIYSDRPVIPFYEMAGWQWALPMARYSDPWRLGRKLLDRGLRAGVAVAYRPMQQAKARLLLTRLLATPHEWEAHIELMQGELILAMAYGYEPRGRDDRKIDVSRRVAKMGSETALPSDLLVNGLPFLRHIPEWLSWFSYKPLARIGHDLGMEMMNEPIRFVRESMVNGTARPSLALENLQESEKLDGPEREKAEKVITETLASIFAAGADTTVSAMMSFILAVLLRPDLQKKAQEELDAVTGRERLPTFDDRQRLPLIDAMCKEVTRWMPVTPLGLPHASTEDNVYEGFFIPKGALVIGNTWAILHDSATYPEPNIFKPERFLKSDGSSRDDPTLTSAFGFGKRICPGRHFAEATLFIVIASMLSVFNIEKRPGSDGGLPFSYSYTGSILSRPNSFPCSITPRDKLADELVTEDEDGP
ncbi:cytochrome P450 [Multifurca ochricompacta]|uniref:Cytochrome P450 n=1 Tax=Multifurca ochricompacta TaxID=376703 RepID=A0AAD4QN25_9AGAM|nr:cytochrome P450 [Multifurca ochricompacta]